MDVDGARLREVDAIVSRARRLGDSRAEVRAAIVVGSYAYGRPTMDSDIDVVLVLADRHRLLAQDAWVGQLLGEPFELVREQDWGPLRERRFETSSGLQVEVGLVTTEWLATPVDPGTARVLTDGCLILSDSQGLVRDALRWLALPVTEWTSAETTGSGKPPQG
jgi:predicted nucleotidyltransferase